MSPVASRIERSALIVTIDRPEARNALSGELIAQLSRVIRDVASGAAPDVRALILTGAGDRSFVAGADIGEMREMDAAQLGAYAAAGQGLTLAIEALPIPVIAAVNGAALGGGFELALACDLVCASANARFALPETGLGIVPGFGGSVRLPRRIGDARAREMIYTGLAIDAARAFDLGLVAKVVAEPRDVVTAALEIVDALSSRAPLAVASAKATISRAHSLALARALELERRAFVASFQTADAREGLRAFAARERPRFAGV